MVDEREIDRLYSLPLGEFTPARNELAKTLRKAGEREEAAEVQKLAKPSVTAWALNLLYHRHRETFDRLLAAAREQREAVSTSAAELRAAGERKRRRQTELLGLAEEILADAGTRPSPTLRQRISRTLDALAAWPPGEDPPPLGRLVKDLEPAGFDALLGASVAAPAPGRAAGKPAAKRAETGRSRAKSKRGDKAGAAKRVRHRAARGELEEAKRQLAAARKAETAARRKLARAEKRAAKTLAEARAAESAAEAARKLLDEAQLALRRARTSNEAAARESERQQDRLDAAQRRLAALDG